VTAASRIRPAAILRHAPPMLLVDRVTSVRPGERLRASWRVPASWPILAGHFPGAPIVPGVMLVEAMAQAAGLLAWATEPFERDRARMYLAAVERARFARPAGPGDRLAIEVRLGRRRGPFWWFEGSVASGREPVAEAGFTAALYVDGERPLRRVL